jgi:hypothetical protein
MVVKAIEEWNSTTTAIEARDFPSLFALASRRGPLRGGIAAIKKWERSTRDFCKRYRKATSRNTVLALLAAYREGQLGFSFGIMPTVADMRQIYELATNGVPEKRTRIVRRLTGQTEYTKDVSSSGWNANYGKYTRKEYISNFHVDGVCVDLKRPMYRTDFGKYLNALVGVNGSRLLWDVLPFSWCIDSFLSIDDMLDNLWLGSQTEYDVAYWSSSKLIYRRDVRGMNLVDKGFYPSTIESWPWQSADTMRAEYTHYNRTPRLPPSIIDSARFRLGATQAWLTILVGLGLVPSRLTSKIRARY